jgi:hypothetical protein
LFEALGSAMSRGSAVNPDMAGGLAGHNAGGCADVETRLRMADGVDGSGTVQLANSQIAERSSSRTAAMNATLPIPTDHPHTGEPGCCVERLVGPRTWTQEGFIVVSDANGMPLVHDWHCAKWMAESRVRMITRELPERLRKNLTIAAATLRFEWPNDEDEP